MRRTTIAMCALSALFLAACGATGGRYANKPRPPVPINLTVYINNARVSLSPGSVGAGPVTFLVTNVANQTESMMIQSRDGSRTLASTGPINPQTTAEVTVDFQNPGAYSLATSQTQESQSQQTAVSSIQPATLHIGPARPNSSNQLLQP